VLCCDVLCVYVCICVCVLCVVVFCVVCVFDNLGESAYFMANI